MITNDRQYRITKAQCKNIKKAVDAFDLEEATKRIGSVILANAELDALSSEEEVLLEQVREYESLKSGAISISKANNLEELPKVLIQARIARGLTQRQLAEDLGIKEQQIQRYESEKYASASLTRLKEIAKVLQLSIEEVSERSHTRQYVQHKWKKIDWQRFPVKDMYRRNWFEGFLGSQTDAINYANILVEKYITKVIHEPIVALRRQRTRLRSTVDPLALLAWECRILTLAQKKPINSEYDPAALDEEWFRRLAQESRFYDGPLRAKNLLAKSGIHLIIEPHIPHTHLDGAAFLRGDKPVIGMTLRFDRVDNFWFVLFHELIHIKKHLSKDENEQIFDDLEADPDNLERDADSMAGQMLIPEQLWDTALARYVRSRESVLSFAKKLKISPAIVAGRIRKEANNYVILNELVGNAQARKNFPEVNFGR
jgi:HTH-type transcriptional regulator/antitoxin HigA